MSIELACALVATAADHYGLRLVAPVLLEGGDESVVWRVESEGGPLVLVLYPTWRTREELGWVHRFVTEAGRMVSEAVAPLAAPDGSIILCHGEGLIALFPFVDGSFLDREDSHLRASAARLLARLHRAFLQVSVPGPRPPSRADAPATWPCPPDPAELIDPELDALVAALQRGERRLVTAPIHGDYYRRNVLCRGGEIVGVIDWNEAHVDWLIRELAWSIWEFAQNGAGTELLVERAQEFLEAYAGAGGPIPADEYDLIIPFIRVRLREEIRLYRAARQRGLVWDAEYAAAETIAFQELSGPPILKTPQQS